MASIENLKIRQAMREAGREFGLEVTDMVLDGMAGAHLLPDALPPEYAEVISDAIRGTAGTIAAGLEQEGTRPSFATGSSRRGSMRRRPPRISERLRPFSMGTWGANTAGSSLLSPLSTSAAGSSRPRRGRSG